MTDYVGAILAQTEILTQQVAEYQEQAAKDRRHAKQLLHDLSVIINAMETLPDIVDRLEAIAREHTSGALWIGEKMARDIGIEVSTLALLAREGKIRGYQSNRHSRWYYDPAEVREDIKRLKREQKREAVA